MGAQIIPEVTLTRKNGQVIILTHEKIENAVVVTFDDGIQLVLDPEDKLEKTNTVINLSCDNPRCKTRNNTPGPVSITIDEAQAKLDPLSVPDVFWRSVKIVPDPKMDSAMWFCGSQCCKDFLTYAYTPPKTPRDVLEDQKLTDSALTAIETANTSWPSVAELETKHV